MCLSRESWLCVVCAYWRAAVWWTIEEQQIFNHFIYTSFKGFLCNTRIWVYVGFCRWIHFKMMKLHPESWTFICLLFSCWHWSFFSLLVLGSIISQIIAKDYCTEDNCYSFSQTGLLSDFMAAKCCISVEIVLNLLLQVWLGYKMKMVKISFKRREVMEASIFYLFCLHSKIRKRLMWWWLRNYRSSLVA